MRSWKRHGKKKKALCIKNRLPLLLRFNLVITSHHRILESVYNLHMKLAILLPGFLDSPDYLHIITIEKGLQTLGYTVVRLDPCGLWKNGDIAHYSITNYLKDVRTVIDDYKNENPQELILVGHSVGGFVSIIAGERYAEVTKIIALCPPSGFDNPPVKWKDKEYRIAHRNLPNDQTLSREFKVPISFAYDSFTYNAIEAVKKIEKPLMILIALEDSVVPPQDTEKLVMAARNPYTVKLKRMGHDFRYSEKECALVMDEIEKFLSKV